MGDSTMTFILHDAQNNQHHSQHTLLARKHKYALDGVIFFEDLHTILVSRVVATGQVWLQLATMGC